MDITLLYFTVNSHEQAIEISSELLKEKLIACANIGREMTSIYEWEGQLQVSNEHAVVLKTTPDIAHTAIARIKQLHSYEIPCILSQQISEGNPDFLGWVHIQVQ